MIQRNLLLLGALVAAVAAETPSNQPSVRVERQRVLYYSKEYLRHAQYLRKKGGDSIVSWGWRILEWPLDSGKYRETVPENPKYRFSNGSVAMDVDGDGNDELIVSRYERENWKGHEFLWYERVPGQAAWREHKIGYIEAPGKEMPHDMQPLLMRLPDGSMLQSFVLTIGRLDMYLFERPRDPREPWHLFPIGHLPDPPQSGMQIADINGDGRPDIVTGMFWVECPPDPRTGTWKFHRYGDWDSHHKPWGGMNKHGVADFDGDGSLEIAVNEAESPDSRLMIYKRDPSNPDGLWKSTLLDTGLYCPHTMVVADVNGDGRPDILVGEMDAGGWEFPLITNPRIYAYLNEGGLKFRRVILAEGLGIHEGKIAPVKYDGHLMLFGNSTTQPWFDGMITNLTTYTLEPLPRVDRTQYLFQDDFEGRLSEGWSWVREQPQTWSLRKGALVVRTLPGTLWGSTNTAKNLLLRELPSHESDWAAEVRVSLHPSLDGEQAGLLLYGDDDNYIKLVKEYKDRAYAILVREQNQSGKTIGRLPISEDAVELRLVSRAGVVQAYMREGSAGAWRLVGECEPLPRSGLRIGLLTHVSPGETDRSAEFSWFRILQR